MIPKRYLLLFSLSVGDTFDQCNGKTNVPKALVKCDEVLFCTWVKVLSVCTSKDKIKLLSKLWQEWFNTTWKTNAFQIKLVHVWVICLALKKKRGRERETMVRFKDWNLVPKIKLSLFYLIFSQMEQNQVIYYKFETLLSKSFQVYCICLFILVN